MEVKSIISSSAEKLKRLFVKETPFSQKKELNLSSFKWLGLVAVLVFVCTILLMPSDVPVQFSEKIETPKRDSPTEPSVSATRSSSSSQLWASPRREFYGTRGGGGGSSVNYNTAMVVGGGTNAKTQLHAGVRLPLRILDKVIVSQDSVPVLAELIVNSDTESGLKLPAGTKFYGEASFSKGSDRAIVAFKQISLPNGQMRPINARATGKDGQGGVPGLVYSDGVKNTTGQVITSFVGGLAAGSVQTDVFGRSQGGIGNGLLTAVSDTARMKAQNYGEKLKAEREWIEIQPNTECDAQLFEAMNLQTGGASE